jgi:ring-1,2-phenylacetyl-CoA epoxidase subunit PaaC
VSPTSESLADSVHNDLALVADACFVTSHRLTEWVSNAPTMEEDVAVGNIALDLLGQARGLYGILGDEDQLVYFRDADDWHHPEMCELPNGDFGHTMLRLLFISEWLSQVWPELAQHDDDQVRGVAQKAIKENAYHLRHAGNWVTRLEDGTPESMQRMKAARAGLAPYADGLTAAAPPGGRDRAALVVLLTEMQSLARAHPGATW